WSACSRCTSTSWTRSSASFRSVTGRGRRRARRRGLPPVRGGGGGALAVVRRVGGRRGRRRGDPDVAGRVAAGQATAQPAVRVAAAARRPVAELRRVPRRAAGAPPRDRGGDPGPAHADERAGALRGVAAGAGRAASAAGAARGGCERRPVFAA